MGIWQRLRGIEDRQESGSYTEALVQLLQSRAGGASALPGATAALEAASGFVSRAFASADVTTADSTMAGILDPHTLAMIGRALIRQGEYVAVIKMDMENSTPRLATAASWDVLGGEDPASWTYRVSLAGPGEQTAFENIPAAGVVHVRYSSDTTTPWRGDDPEIDLLKGDIKALGGGLAFVESQADQFGSGPTTNPSSGWQLRRLGADIPSGSIEAARLAFSEVVAACGLSVALWDDSTGTGRREGYRQALHSVIAPLGRIAAAELTAKLETAVEMDWRELRAGDISGRARALQSMVGAGMDLAKAMSLSGLMVSDE